MKCIVTLLAVFLIWGCSKEKNVGGNSQKISSDSLSIVDSLSMVNKGLEFKDIHICTELLPPPPPNSKIRSKLDTTIIYQNETRTDTLISNSIQSYKAYAAILTDYYWMPNHRDLKVMFLDGDTVVQRKVMLTAKKWESYCGIRFNFGIFEDADITISFLYQGSWSYIGSFSQKVQPSMNFGWLYRTTDQKEYDRVVLHEFGHALGFVHEHQSPRASIPWDSQKVYQYYKSPPNKWDMPTIDMNIFKKYSFNEVNATEFDPTSIMLYAIPAALLKDEKYATSENSELSQFDKSFASLLYPQKVPILPNKTTKKGKNK